MTTREGSEGTATRAGAVMKGIPFAPAYAPPRILRADAAMAAELLRQATAESVLAKRDATATLQRARTDGDQILRQAREQAKAELDKAIEDARADARRRVEAMMISMDEQLGRVVDDLARHAQRAAWSIAARVLRVEFACKPERIVDLVEKTIREARLYESLTVVVNPEDYEVVRPHTERLRGFTAMASTFEVRPDATLPRGSVRIDTEMGGFDGGLKARLERLEAQGLDGDAAGKGEGRPA